MGIERVNDATYVKLVHMAAIKLYLRVFLLGGESWIVCWGMWNLPQGMIMFGS